MYETATSGDKDEWLELYNPLEIDVDLNNWSISDNSGTWKFSDIKITRKSYLVITRNATVFEESFGCAAHVSGLTRGLNNDGDQLTLKDNTGSEIDFVAWENGADNAYPSWNIAAQEGKSISRISLSNDSDAAGDWIESTAQPNC